MTKRQPRDSVRPDTLMPIRYALWTVSADPQPVREAALPDGRTLEDMIAARPDILSHEWMPIGRQVRTAHGGIVNLLATVPGGGLVVVELKRDLTPRDVVAQGLDYASWVETLDASATAAIFGLSPEQVALSQVVFPAHEG